MRRYAVLIMALGLLAVYAPVALASGPGGGGTSGGGGGTSGGGGGGTTVNAASCSAITLFSNTISYDPFYPSDPNPATATVIRTELSGTSSCASGGPYTVAISYKNDSNNAILKTDVAPWTIPGNLDWADGTFAPPSTPYTVSYTVSDGSGHVFFSGSQNVLTLPAK